MVALAALAATAISMLAVLMITVVELVVRIAPLLVLGAIALAVIVCQRRHRSQVPSVSPARLRHGETGAALPGGTATSTAPVGLPPMMRHRQRVYVVAGNQTGLESVRPDGYVKASAPQLPPARPIGSYRRHQGGHVVRFPRRSRQTKTRP